MACLGGKATGVAEDTICVDICCFSGKLKLSAESVCARACLRSFDGLSSPMYESVKLLELDDFSNGGVFIWFLFPGEYILFCRTALRVCQVRTEKSSSFFTKWSIGLGEYLMEGRCAERICPNSTAIVKMPFRRSSR